MNLVTKAVLANREGRYADAIEILGEVVAKAREIGFRRMTQMGLERLGEAHLASGQLEAADRAFLESLSMSEEMGMLVEIAGELTRIARVRAEMGRSEEVVAILASVVADPVSRHTTLYEEVAVGDTATALMEEMAGRLDEEVYTAAHSRGTAKPLAVTAKELLTMME